MLQLKTYLNGKQENSRIIDTERFGSPSIAVAGDDRVYIAYFDRLNEQIRFIYGESKTSASNSTGMLTGRKAERRITVYNNTDVRVETDPGIHNDAGGGTYGNHGIFESSNGNYSVVAGVEYPDGGKNGNTASPTGNTAGEYLDISSRL